MLNTILCATDFSDHFRFTVEWGIWLCRLFSARLVVFHAVPSNRDDLYGPDLGAAQRSGIEESRQRLESLMADREADWEPLVVSGDSVERLMPVVASRNIDLVVAASYGLTGIRRMLLGTIVERMARSLNCPLWVVRTGRSGRPPESGIRRVIVACDFLEASRPVLEKAAAMCGTFGAEIHLVHAIEAPIDEELVDPTAGPYEKIQQELQDRMRERLLHLYAGVTTPGLVMEGMVLQGHPGEQVPEYARRCNADLIVVGVHRRSRAEKHLRGSITEAVLRRAPCTVLAIPAAIESPAAGSLERPRP